MTDIPCPAAAGYLPFRKFTPIGPQAVACGCGHVAKCHGSPSAIEACRNETGVGSSGEFPGDDE